MTKFTWYKESKGSVREFAADYMTSDKNNVVLSTSINGFAAKEIVVIRLEPGDYIIRTQL
jgi:hypothetical protein